MSEPNPTPLFDSIDDPRGIVYVLPEGLSRDDIGESVGEYAVERIQAIRWELHSLIVMLDETEGLTGAAEMLIPQAIELLGVVARAEAAYIDSATGEVGPNIFATNPASPRAEDEDEDDG
ncbi:MAG: hypothetical protein ACXVSF_06505 [Solirubrobacteraceae bacterium]